MEDTTTLNCIDKRPLIVLRDLDTLPKESTITVIYWDKSSKIDTVANHMREIRTIFAREMAKDRIR